MWYKRFDVILKLIILDEVGKALLGTRLAVYLN